MLTQIRYIGRPPTYSCLLRLILPLIVALTTAQAFAESCTITLAERPDVNVPELNVGTSMPFRFWVNSRIRNNLILRNPFNKFEGCDIAPSVVRQHGGTCVFQSLTTSIEIILKKNGVMPAQGRILRFLPLMHIARERFNRDIDDFSDLEQLIGAIKPEEIWRAYVGKQTVYFSGSMGVDPETKSELQDYVERFLLLSLDFAASGRAAQDLLVKLMRAPEAEFEVLSKKMVTEAVAQYAKKQVPLAKFRIDQLEGQHINRMEDDDWEIKHFQATSSANGHTIDLKEFGEQSGLPFRSEIAGRIVQALAANRPVMGVVDGFFSESIFRQHAVALTRYRLSANRSLLGFEFINSFGPFSGSRGRGYFSIENVRASGLRFIIVDAVKAESIARD